MPTAAPTFSACTTDYQAGALTADETGWRIAFAKLAALCEAGSNKVTRGGLAFRSQTRYDLVPAAVWAIDSLWHICAVRFGYLLQRLSSGGPAKESNVLPSCQLHRDVQLAIIVVCAGVRPNSIPTANSRRIWISVSCRLNGAHRVLGVKPHCGHVGAV